MMNVLCIYSCMKCPQQGNSKMSIFNQRSTHNNGYYKSPEKHDGGNPSVIPRALRTGDRDKKNKENAGENAYLLTRNFLAANSNWSIDSLYDYCHKYYGPFGLTKIMFAECVREYILAKTNLSNLT